MTSDLAFFLCGQHCHVFDSRETEDLQAVKDPRTDRFAVFPDASGKDQQVEPAQYGEIACDRFPNCGTEDVDREE